MKNDTNYYQPWLLCTVEDGNSAWFHRFLAKDGTNEALDYVTEFYGHDTDGLGANDIDPDLVKLEWPEVKSDGSSVGHAYVDGKHVMYVAVAMGSISMD